MKRFFPGIVAVSSIVLLALRFASCTSPGVRESSRVGIESAHGIKLPESASSFQQGSFASGPDKGVVSMFQCRESDLPDFLSSLKIRARFFPVVDGAGDPCANGWNVWPENAPTFVPGNDEFAGLQKTWQGSAVPVEMLSCDSSRGDWMHLEIWKISTDDLVIKLYTDIN